MINKFRSTPSIGPLLALALALAAVMTAHCGSSPTAPSPSGSTTPPGTTSPTTSAALASLTLGSPTIVGGESVTGAVTLTAAAQTGGAVVTLSGGDPANVPTSVTVPAGSTSSTFMISTRVVGGTIPVTINASYGGASASAVLSVTRPTTATAHFGVSGPNETETCSMTTNGTGITCTFNGTTSTAPSNIVSYDWSFGVAKTFRQTTTGPILALPAADCSLLPPAPLPAGTTWLNMTVTLVVHDDQGNVSPEASDTGMRLFPNGACGY